MRRLRINTELPSSIQTVRIGTQRYRVRLDWRERCAAWYVSISRGDGTALATGKKLVANWSPTESLAVDEGIVFLCVDTIGGRDRFARHDLGATVLLIVGETSELTAPTADPNDWRVVGA